MTSPTTAYLRDWHRRRATCPGWAAASDLAAAVGPRPEGHVLALLDGAVATCGACDECRASGATRNVVWIVGERGGRATMILHGVRMVRAEAARRLGISREALSQRMRGGGDPARAKDPPVRGVHGVRAALLATRSPRGFCHVPAAVRALMVPGHAMAKVHTAILAIAEAGEIELLPGDKSRLRAKDGALCPVGPRGALLSRCRFL